MTTAVLVIETPSIKAYVFGTDKLKEIRGASAILDELNRDLTPEFLARELGAVLQQLVFANGGAAQAIVQLDEARLSSAMDELARVYRDRTAGAVAPAWAVSPITAGDYAGAVARAHRILALDRDRGADPPGVSAHGPFIRECDSCATGLGLVEEAQPEGVDLLCRVCATKRRKGRSQRLWRELTEMVEKEFGGGIGPLEPAPDLETIAAVSSRPGYGALIYADGNAMGRLLQRLQTPAAFAAVSEACDRGIRLAVAHAIAAHCEPTAGGPLSGDVLLLGGDDLVVYVPADVAIEFAITVATGFETETRRLLHEAASNSAEAATIVAELGGNGLTLSLGVAIGRARTPIRILLESAEQLLASAKRKGAEDRSATRLRVPSYVDFHLASASGLKDIDDVRASQYTISGEVMCQLTRRPYATDALSALVDDSRKLGALPRTRRHRLGRAPYLGYGTGALETLRILGRARESERHEIRSVLERHGCAETPPWRVRAGVADTVLVDLLEIAELRRGGEDA